MAFCTKCGANVSGTFCSQCGTPAASAAAQAAPPPPPPPAAPYVQAAPYTQPGVPYGQPVPRKTSPIVWVLVIVLGLFVLGGIGVMATVAYFAHRVHQAVQMNPNGDGGFSIKAHGDDGKDASVQFGGSIGKLPSWVPAYPGANAKGTFSVKSGNGDAGNFTYTTPDDAERVKAFYADKCKELGMKVNLESTTSDGAMFVAADENGDKRSLTVVIGKSSGETTVNVTYGTK